ncbi:MAG: lamin tail domain-containing protein [Candidatus Limnocylindria bacterium]
MPVVRAVPFAAHRLLAGLISIGLLALVMDHALAVPRLEGVEGPAMAPVASGHLAVSEVMTGGASASDEFVELYNPTATTLPLEGLEVVYVTATGATVTRKASWAAGAAGVPAGAHLLVANGAGIFAGLADLSYANGLAATGGSVALREIGAAVAIDAVGWGTAANAWLETQAAPAPAAGSSLERLPGGSSGSGQDTDDNLLDFAVQPVPDPQNAGSAVIPGPSPSPGETASAVPTASPTASATPTGSMTPEPTATPSITQSPSISPTPTPTVAPTATPVPTPIPMTIAEARSEPDGATVTVEGVSLTGGDFTDGGGYLVDASAGIAVLVADGTFARGQRMLVTGTVDDRYAQRTIRATADTIVSLGAGSEPLPLDAATGSIDEALEGRLVEVSGVISSGVTTLSTGLAWDVDDGTGASRILVGTATGIDTSSWARGVGLTVVGVVGQRDSTGTGASGFRIQPRDPSDLLSVEPVATPGPSPTPQPTAAPVPSVTPSPTAIPSAPLVSIDEARAATTGTRLRVRGVVTAPSGLIEVGSAVVQDASGAILIRMGTDLGTLNLGQLVELDGTRATKAGMLSLRVSTAPQYLGTQADPEPLRRASGAVGEAEEARLVIVRGAISSAISRPRAGNVSFAVDDGSGPLRVTISTRSSISTGSLTRGAWLELRGVLSQETTGSAPSSGYRLWPRIPADLRVVATAVAGTTGTSTCCIGSRSPHAGSPGTTSGANEDQVVAQAAGRAPSLARPQATGSPRPLPTIGSAVATPRDVAAPAGGLVISGMGLAALAGLAAWFGRRRGPDDDQPTAEVAGDAAEAPETAGPLRLPRLSVLRSEAADARKERRILPPT